jgi:hypothetical protein
MAPRDPAALTHTDVELKQRQKITVKTSDTNLAELKGECHRALQNQPLMGASKPAEIRAFTNTSL